MRPRLAELVSYMDASRERLMSAVSGMNPTFATVRPNNDAWSVADNLTHLALVEEGVARLIVKSVDWAKSHGIGQETSDESIMSSLDKFALTTAAMKRKAPEMVMPPADQPMETSLAALQSSRPRLKDAFASAEGMDFCQVKRAHPVLGEIDLYQWALFVAQHEDRHRAQIERTLTEVTELAAECAPIV